jgi:hypothetical protein
MKTECLAKKHNQWNTTRQTQNQFFVTNAERSSLNQFNIEEREHYQDQEKRDQFETFYDNREQSMKAYVEKQSENQKISNQSQKKVFEDIDLTEKNDRDDQNDQFVYNLNINCFEICKKCDVKREIFKLNNVFHAHIRDCKENEKDVMILSSSKLHDLLIVKFTIKNTIHKDYEFRFYQYAIAWMKITLNKFAIERIIDIECAMSLMNTKYFISTLSKANITNMSILINVRDIKNTLHQSSSYVMLDLYLNEMTIERKVRDHIKREFHLMNELKCKLLMRLNVMTSKKMIINLTNKFLIILTCENLTIFIKINSKFNSRIRRIVHSKKLMTIFLNSIINIFTYLREKKLSFNRDYLFESNHETLTTFLEKTSDLYIHMCDCNLAFVHVRNELLKSIIISLKTRLNLLTKYEEKNCFQVENEYHEWVIIANEVEADKNFNKSSSKS